MIANLDDFLGAVDFSIRDFGNMEKTFEPLLQFHEHSKVGDLRHRARDEVALCVLARNLLDPGIVLELLDTESDPLLGRFHGEHNRLDPLALFEHLVGMVDLLGPRHVGHMKQTVDALLELDEGAVGRDVANQSFDDRSRRITLLDLIPGIDIGLLHAERNLLLVRVDIENHDLDLIVE